MAIERVDPYGRFNFLVEIDGIATAGFQEVSGLDIRVDVVEYREGGDPAVRKLPGRTRYSNVVLRRGVVGSLSLYEWIEQVRTDALAARRAVRISLLDEARAAVMSWRLRDAWPVKLEGPDLNATSNEVAIETLELTHDGLCVE